MPTVARRRDRVRDADAAPEDEERPRRRRREPEDDEPREPLRHSSSQDREPEDDDRPRRSRRDEEPDDDDLVDEPRNRRRRQRATQDEVDRHAERAVRRASRDEEPDDDDRPRRGGKRDVPEGVRSGWDGAEQTTNSGGGGDVNWLKMGDRVELVKFLEEAPLTSFRQHWIEGGNDERKSRPYLCPGSKCPVCGQGASASAYYIFNVLHLSGGSFPEVKALQLNQSAYKDLKEVFNDRKTGQPVIDLDFASIKKSGKGFQTRTKFTKVKDRDLEDDWDEIFEYFDLNDLDKILDEAEDELYTIEEVSPKATPRRELEKLARYLDEPDDD